MRTPPSTNLQSTSASPSSLPSSSSVTSPSTSIDVVLPMMNRDKKLFDDCVDQHFLTMTAINTAMMMIAVLMMPTILKNAWSSCKNRIDCNRRKLFPEPMHNSLPKEMLTSRWSLQSKMQPNVSRKRSALVPRIPCLMKHPTQNRSGSLSLGPSNRRKLLPLLLRTIS